jgi:hypothetical protein
MFDEAFMEDCIEEAPKVFLGCDLKVTERQAKIGGFRPDIVGVHQEETWIVEIQQRALDNLSIVWRPTTPDYDCRGIYKVGDWARWPGEDTYGWSRPSNEIIFIRDINRLRPGEVRLRRELDVCNWDVLDELFISLLKASYDWLCGALSSVVHVDKITDFEFDLVDPSPCDFDNDSLLNAIRAPKRIAGWSIYNLEARKREEEAKWIENFENDYKISVKYLTDAYNSCLSRGRNRVASNRTKYIATDLGKEGIRLSKSQLDQIVARLQEHHSHYIHLAKD